jgi:hypothetical protein
VLLRTLEQPVPLCRNGGAREATTGQQCTTADCRSPGGSGSRPRMNGPVGISPDLQRKPPLFCWLLRSTNIAPDWLSRH